MNNTETLVDRLRGKYTVPINDGAGPLDGKTEFTRDFSAFIPPIHLEAASEIERLRVDAQLLDALLSLNVDVLPAVDGKWLLIDFRVEPPRTTEHESGRAAVAAALL